MQQKESFYVESRGMMSETEGWVKDRDRETEAKVVASSY